jgi:hypothetical protein
MRYRWVTDLHLYRLASKIMVYVADKFYICMNNNLKCKKMDENTRLYG